MECEQKQKEQEMEKIMAEFQLTKQRTDEARRVAELNKSRAEEAERESNLSDNDTVRNFLKNQRPEESSELPIEDSRAQSFAQIRLKRVDLPKFSGEDTNDYEPWKAAFMSVVDRLNIPVGEKMLRLISSLSGKALTLVKDLGYTESAYEKTKEKLEKKYGGQRRLQIKHLTTLRNWKKSSTTQPGRP